MTAAQPRPADPQPTRDALSLHTPSNLRILDDAHLLDRFTRLGDPHAFAVIVDRYTNLVIASARRILGDTARAEEAAQETFFRLLRKPHRVTRSLAGWLHRTAARIAIDTIRSDAARQQRENAYASMHIDEHDPWMRIAPRIDAAIAQLDDQHAWILLQHYFQKRSLRSLARETQTSPATMSRRLHAAHLALRQKLEHDRPDDQLQLPTLTDALALAALAAAIPTSPNFALGLARLQSLLGAQTATATTTTAAAASLTPTFILASLPAGKTLAALALAAAASLVCIAAVAAAWRMTDLTSRNPPTLTRQIPAPINEPQTQPDPATAQNQPDAAQSQHPQRWIVQPASIGSLASTTIVAVTIPENTQPQHPDAPVLVLFGDGHVQQMTYAKLQRQISASTGLSYNDWAAMGRIITR